MSVRGSRLRPFATTATARKLAGVINKRAPAVEKTMSYALRRSRGSLPSRKAGALDGLLDELDVFATELEALELTDPRALELRERSVEMIDQTYDLVALGQRVVGVSCGRDCLREAKQELEDYEELPHDTFEVELENYCSWWAR